MKLEHISPYLPYGLKGIGIGSKIHTLSKIQTEYKSCFWWVLDENHKHGRIDCKPILHPLTDLTKEIEHNGGKFVPMLELFRMLDTSDYVDFYGNISNPSYQIDDGWNHCLSFDSQDDLKEGLGFSYDSCNNSFLLMDDWRWQPISNQLAMFQKLFEWKFDVFELIEQGEAIDVNTLPKNPYK